MRHLPMLSLAVLIIVIAVAVIVSDDADADGEMARIGDVYYASLNDALDSAVDGDVVIVLDGCRLSSDAAVPAGVTLLLPYSDGRGDVDLDGWEYGPDPTKTGNYRKKAGDSLCVTHLQIDDSARLTVYGDVIIGGIISEKFTFDYQGHTSGEHGRIVLKGHLIMENGSSLKCYGYITGSGDVTARNGSSVYEPFIITDFIGGDRMLDLYQAKQSPFDRYSFSNIESSLTIDYGARLIGMLNIYADGSINSSDINIIGIQGSHSKSLIELVSGSSATISYDKTKYVKAEWSSNIWNDVGKTTVSMDGGADMNILMLTYQDHSADMTGIPFSLPYNFDYILNGGTYNINADLRILPGASLTVAEDASLTVNSRLIIFNGLVDIPYRDKYYPTPELLQQFNFNTHGSLYVNGSLQISGDGSVLGVIESTAGNPVITVDPDVKEYRDWYVNYGTGSYTVRKLSLWVCYDDTFFVLQPGSQYSLSSGTTETDGFTYIYGGETITKDVKQTYQGRYVPMSSTPVFSMTLSLDNVNVSDAAITLTKGSFEIPLTFESGMYVSYSGYDGDYSVKISISGKDVNGGTVSIKDGKGAASVSLYTVSFISDGSAVGDDISAYGDTVVPPVPVKTGYTFNGWYDGDVVFTSRSKVTHRATLDALWGEDTEEHRNVTGDMFPVTVTDVTKDVSAFFDEGSVKVFVDLKEQSASGPFSITYENDGEGYSILTIVNNQETELLKTITLPYDTMRPGAAVICGDGHDVTDVVFNASSQTVTFTSYGSYFVVSYDPDPEPLVIKSPMELGIMMIIAAAVLAMIIIAIAVISARKR